MRWKVRSRIEIGISDDRNIFSIFSCAEGTSATFRVLNQLRNGGLSFAKPFSAENHLQRTRFNLEENIEQELIELLECICTTLGPWEPCTEP